jgi:hypothetical protein
MTGGAEVATTAGPRVGPTRHQQADVARERDDARLNGGVPREYYRAATTALRPAHNCAPTSGSGSAKGKHRVCYDALTKEGCPHGVSCRFHHVNGNAVCQAGRANGLPAVELVGLLKGGFPGISKPLPTPACCATPRAPSPARVAGISGEERGR